MSLLDHQLELLSPAKTAEIVRETILHGADAVYIGGPAFGTRDDARKSLEENASLMQFALCDKNIRRLLVQCVRVYMLSLDRQTDRMAQWVPLILTRPQDASARTRQGWVSPAVKNRVVRLEVIAIAAPMPIGQVETD